MEYGKFIEIKGAKPFLNPFVFLSKAVGTDASRYFMNVVLCEGGKLIATDGRRLHIIERDVSGFGFEEGKCYRMLKANTKECWFSESVEIDSNQFPKWKNVIPKESDGTSSMIYYSYSKNRDEYSQNIAKLYRSVPSGNSIRMKYIDDLTIGEQWEIIFHGQNSAITIKSYDGICTAIVMPMWED